MIEYLQRLNYNKKVSFKAFRVKKIFNSNLSFIQLKLFFYLQKKLALLRSVLCFILIFGMVYLPISPLAHIPTALAACNPGTTALASTGDPTTATIAPESGITDAGGFSFVGNGQGNCSGSSDTITQLNVSLAGSGTPYDGLAEVRITSSDGGTLYFTTIISFSSNSLTFSGGTGLPVVYGSATTFKIRITPKTHGGMDPVTGASYDLSPTVTNWTGARTHAGSDANANTITIDNASPNSATAVSGSAGNTNNTLNWTGSDSADIASSVILRWAADSAGAEVPEEGTTYTAGNTITTATVACVLATSQSESKSSIIDGTGGTAGCTTSALSNDQAYSYVVYQQDNNDNYDASTTIGTFTPTLTPVTTIAAGSDPSTTTVAPESGIADAGTFTLQTNIDADSVTALTVTLAGAGTPYAGLAEVRITSSDGGTLYFAAVTSFSDNTVDFSLGTPIPVTISETSFKIRVTPKAHTVMDAVPGASYALSAYVSAFSTTNSQSGSDSNANTFTIDNASPSDATASTATAGDQQVSLAWTNPGDSDFNSVVVLRSTSAVSDSPVEGTTYNVNDNIGSATVACVTASESCTDSSLANGTPYHYKIFTKDSRSNYAAGIVPSGSPATPAAILTTLGNGTNPSDTTAAPGSGIIDLNTFTFQASAGADSVTALTVTLAADTYAGISEIRITSNNGSTLYFSAVSDPATDTVNFSGGTPIPVTTSETSFKIRITPKTHADMDPVPGASYAVTGTITAFTSTNSQAGGDASSATITIDNASPSDASASTATAGDQQVSLAWTNPGDSDFNSVVVLRSTSAVSDAPVEGVTYNMNDNIGSATVVRVTASESWTNSSLSNGTAYHYKIFTKDSRGNYAAGIVPTGSPATPTQSTPPEPPSTNTSGGGSWTFTTPEPTITPPQAEAELDTPSEPGLPEPGLTEFEINPECGLIGHSPCVPGINAPATPKAEVEPAPETPVLEPQPVPELPPATETTPEPSIEPFPVEQQPTSEAEITPSPSTQTTPEEPAIRQDTPIANLLGYLVNYKLTAVAPSVIIDQTEQKLSQTAILVYNKVKSTPWTATQLRILQPFEHISDGAEVFATQAATQTLQSVKMVQSTAQKLAASSVSTAGAIKQLIDATDKSITNLNKTLTINTRTSAIKVSVSSVQFLKSAISTSDKAISNTVAAAENRIYQDISDTKTAISAIGSGFTKLADSSGRLLARLQHQTTNLITSLEPPNFITLKPLPETPDVKKDTLTFKSGNLVMVADQNKPIQSVVGFIFDAEIQPSSKAEKVGGTFKFNDLNEDGTWTAKAQMPEVEGEFDIRTEIAYLNGNTKNITTAVLIDPEGYVYEQHSRGELRIAQAKITLWHKAGNKWKIWPAMNYNQINPQITGQTGQYSFLAPAGEYYLEASADNYQPYRGEPFNLSQTSPIHQIIRLEYEDL